MAGVMQLRPPHVAAVNGGQPGGPCAPCADAPPRATPRPAPTRTVLRFHEFKNYASLHAVWRLGMALSAQHRMPVRGSSTVYVFRRLRGRTTLAATLPGGRGTYVIPGTPAVAGAEYWLCLSHVTLPAARVTQLCDPAHRAALERRCMPLNPGDRRMATPAGAGTYDVTLIDWRAMGDQLHAWEQERFRALYDIAEDPARAQRRLLAELTLATAAHYEREDDDVWKWFARGRRPANWNGPRAYGLDGKPYTACEAELATYAQNIKKLQENTETAAAAKYTWMENDGYREMRWDTLADPAAHRETIKSEARMIAPASQSDAGQKYLREYAAGDGNWYSRFLRNPRDHEVEAFRDDPASADAFWAIFASVGAGLLAGGRGDRSSQEFDVAKNTGGAADAVAKGQLGRKGGPAEAADKAAEGRRNTGAVASAADQTAALRRAGAAEADRVARAPLWVVETYLLPVLQRRIGGSVPFARYDPRLSRMVAVELVQGARLTTEGAVNPAARAATAAAAHARAEQHFFDAVAFERAYAGRAWLTTSAVGALGVINVALAYRALAADDSPQNRLKMGGAIADLIYAGEFGLVRLQARAVRGAATSTDAAAAGGARAGLLFGLRVAGVVGGVVSIVSAMQDAATARRRGNVDLRYASYASAFGAGMITAGILATMAGGYVGTTGAVATVVAFVGGAAFAIVGALIVLAAAGLIWLFTDPPVEDWIKSSPWGIDPAGGKSDAQQLEGLLKLLCTPGVEAHAYGASHVGLPAGVRGPGVKVTVRPPMFFPGESSVTCRLEINRVMVSGRSAGGGFPVRQRVEGATITLALGDAARRELAGRRATRLALAGATAPRQRGVVVIAREEQGHVAFDCYIPVRRPLDSRRQGWLDVDSRWFECAGSADVHLWAYNPSSAWRRLRLEQMPLRSAAVRGTD